MAFSLAVCRGCGLKVLIDGPGYCMHCGSAVAEGEPLDAALGEELSRLTEPEAPAGDWTLDDLLPMLDRGEFERFAAALDERLGPFGPEERTEFADTAASEVVGWVLGTVWRGDSYRGGILAVVPVLEVEGDDGTSPHAFIRSMFDTVMSLGEEGADPFSMVESGYALLAEYLLSSPSLRDQMGLIDSFIVDAGVEMEAGGLSPEAAEAVGSMCDAAERLRFAMTNALSDLEEDVSEVLVTHWAERGIAEIGSKAMDVLTRIYDECFDDSVEFWSAMDRDAQAYVDAYLSPNL